MPGLNLLLLVLSLLTFLAALIVWPIRYLLSPAGRRRLHAVASAARLGFMRVARRADSERRAPAAQPLPVASVGSPMEGKQRGTSLAEGAAGPSVETAQDHALIAPLQASADPSPEAAGSGTQVPAAPTDSDPLGVRRMPRDQFGRAAHVLAGVACGDFVLFAIGLAVVFTTQAGLAYGATPLAFAVLALGVVGAVLTALVVVCAFLIWRDHLWNLAGRIFYTLVTLAAVAFVWELVLWNLLGVHV